MKLNEINRSFSFSDGDNNTTIGLVNTTIGLVNTTIGLVNTTIGLVNGLTVNMHA